jgi:hypothetical protein
MAYALGQLIGMAILVLVIVGIVRTMSRKDLSTKEKVLGEDRRRRPDQPPPR